MRENKNVLCAYAVFTNVNFFSFEAEYPKLHQQHRIPHRKPFKISISTGVWTGTQVEITLQIPTVERTGFSFSFSRILRSTPWWFVKYDYYKDSLVKVVPPKLFVRKLPKTMSARFLVVEFYICFSLILLLREYYLS